MSKTGPMATCLQLLDNDQLSYDDCIFQAGILERIEKQDIHQECTVKLANTGSTKSVPSELNLNSQPTTDHLC